MPALAGTAERKIRYYKFDLGGNKFVTEADKVYGWHNKVFRACPPRVSRALGEWLYPHQD